MVWDVYGSFYCLPFKVGNATSNEPTKYVRSQTEQLLQGTSKLISNRVRVFRNHVLFLFGPEVSLFVEFKKPLKEKTSMWMSFEHLCFFASKKSRKQTSETALRC